MSLTRTACRTKVRELLMNSSDIHVTDEELNEWIDDACRDMSRKTMCCQTVCTAIITDGKQ